MNSVSKIKMYTIGILVCLPVALLLNFEGTSSARILFASVLWVLVVFRTTKILLNKSPRTKWVLRALAVPFLYSLALMAIFGAGDVLAAYFSSNVANQSAHVIQESYGQIFVSLPETMHKMWAEKNLVQFDGRIQWPIFVIGLAFVGCVVMFLKSVLEHLGKKKDKELATA